jgi:NADPH:quinone reductase-like Zn-dependent oxidoreductase
MAKILRFHQLGGPEILKIEEVLAQEPKKGEVRLRVQQMGLNRSESMFMHGYYEGAGEIPDQQARREVGRTHAGS